MNNQYDSFHESLKIWEYYNPNGKEDFNENNHNEFIMDTWIGFYIKWNLNDLY